MATAEKPHGSLNGSTRDTLANSSMRRTCRDKMVKVHRDPQRNGSCQWLSTRAILVIVSVIFSCILILPLSRAPALFPQSFAWSQLLKAVSRIPSDVTLASHEVSPPGHTPTVFSSNGRTKQVQWDNYTLILQGQRVLI